MDEVTLKGTQGYVKIIYAAIIFILGLIGGVLPQCVRGMDSKLSSLLNMGSGGVFLAAAILHILPDAADNKQLEEMTCDTQNNSDECEQTMPWAFFFFGVGFLMILSVEAFAHHQPHDYTQITSEISDQRDSLDIQRDYSNDELHNDTVVIQDSKYDNVVEKRQQHAVALVVLFSLSFHSIMEGLAIGSQTGSVFDIFLAIIAHKSLAAFALGIELISHGLQNHYFLMCILLFSLMTPLGIFIGWLSIMNSESSDTIAGGICTALSGGTFLFVAVIEIIPRELQDRSNQGQKVAALCIGFFSIWCTGYMGLKQN